MVEEVPATSAHVIVSTVVEQSTKPGFWEQVLTAEPDALNRLLGDLWRAVHADREAEGRVRRPSLDEVFALVLPEFSIEPFPQALRAKLGNRSVRWLASRIHLHHSHLNRWITGQRDIVNLHDPEASLRQIEDIAAALNVAPAYFAEWRRLWVLLLIDDAFVHHPNLSIGVFQRFGGQLARDRAALNGRSRTQR